MIGAGSAGSAVDLMESRTSGFGKEASTRSTARWPGGNGRQMRRGLGPVDGKSEMGGSNRNPPMSQD